ncbi:hypothetical protein G7Y79_00074g098760 [Physcia stellaris]|nr:hypothetical protein G7Y79_00074g098760 [Physcia stellaris]
MATAAGYFDRKASSSIRPGLAHLQADPSSPHTPQRTFSSAFSSPSISYRNEEEPLIFDFGSRHFSAGFAGETTPRCTLGFGPEESRRVGDYRRWLPDYKKTVRRKSEDEWGENMSCGEWIFDRLIWACILTTIFVNLQNPSITLFSTPTALAVAAGCRSSLVVDIGWSETTVTAIYEYREVHQSRTTRAMKRVTVEMVKMLRKHTQPTSPKDNKTDDEEEDMLEADFEIAEDITTRMAWCPTLQESQRMAQQQQDDQSPTTEISSSPPSQPLSHLAIASDAPSPPPPPPTDPQITVPSPFPSPSKTPSTITLPFTLFAHPTESALLASHLPGTPPTTTNSRSHL